VANLAGTQEGIVAREELLALGLGESAIDHRVARGELHPRYRGVYAVGHQATSRKGWLIAALKACGEHAVLSHRTAADLWGISPSSGRLIEVSGPTHRRSADGLRYRQARLHPDDLAEVDALPVTSVGRTLLDLAGVASRERVERALERAVRLRLFDPTEAQRAIARNKGKKGGKLLSAVIAAFDPQDIETRSRTEQRFVRLIKDYNLPKPVLNTVLEGFEVDALWREQKLIVEIDTYATHGSAKAFERDRERDAILFAAGYRVLRVTDVQLRREPAVIARRIAAALNTRTG
jgi:very-short-patch-repair endonuclease